MLIFIQVIGNCDIFVKQKISVISEIKQDEILLNWKFRTSKTFVQYHELSLKLWTKVAKLSVIFKCMNKS